MHGVGGVKIFLKKRERGKVHTINCTIGSSFGSGGKARIAVTHGRP